MNRSSLTLGLIIAWLVLSVAACGGQATEELIQTAAAEMNFTAADLGSEWELMKEMRLDEIPMLKDVEHVQDANMRMFSATEITGLMTSFVFSTKTAASAVSEMAGDTVRNTAKDLEAQVAGLTMETLDPPDIGDEATMSGGSVPNIGVNIYVLTFRRTNVVAMFSLIASTEVATEELVLNYARKLEAKMH